MTIRRLAVVVVLASTALVQVQTTTAALAATVCNRYCDGRDPGLAPADRVPVSATLYGRTFQLHVNDTDAMTWGSVTGGQGGDEVWLDRSFDGGRSWDGNSRLGATAVPAGSTGWRTGQFNVDDWGANGVGALRACGKAGDRPEIVCTAWARSNWNAWDRRTAAATALMMRFDRGTGLFDSNGWWTGANALTAIADNIKRSGMRSYQYALASTYDKNVNSRQGQFRNEFLDDTGWWGLAWVAAYDITGDSRYLNTARADADWMFSYWDTRCGGGVYWKTDRANKNAIPNSLYIQLNAALSQRIAGDTVYRQRAQAGWAWFQSTGMLNSGNLVNDGINMTTCRNNGDVTWTYNQGVLINALVQLNKLTGDANALATARRIGDALTGSSYLSPGGIMREPNEPDACSGDGVSFKGAAIRGLGVLNSATGGAYDTYLRRNADSAYANDRNSIDAYGSHWAGPFRSTNHSCQHSALDLLNAAP
ncbi:glycoside hydrolase family 76 protein [Actinoplanes bogorensis]|uniref:Glycoside hydrolase family 76 protein n=1 Tax=Paractinoplanes bogorensis TaxID=1610840 RepID=A0ABS5YP04_9ACTN|nr:glycoside hydrolase family 76 protein [Actinoplanes bogorensis]MBU2665184.1 glycoside hydrolase family 76 protein [Actinoplanes bogorensis]